MGKGRSPKRSKYAGLVATMRDQNPLPVRFMTSSPTPAIGRPNFQMATVVCHALWLFNQKHSDAAIALIKKHDIPLHVVERVILRSGPHRQSKSPLKNATRSPTNQVKAN